MPLMISTTSERLLSATIFLACSTILDMSTPITYRVKVGYEYEIFFPTERKLDRGLKLVLRIRITLNRIQPFTSIRIRIRLLTLFADPDPREVIRIYSAGVQTLLGSRLFTLMQIRFWLFRLKLIRIRIGLLEMMLFLVVL